MRGRGAKLQHRATTKAKVPKPAKAYTPVQTLGYRQRLREAAAKREDEAVEALAKHADHMKKQTAGMQRLTEVYQASTTTFVWM